MTRFWSAYGRRLAASVAAATLLAFVPGLARAQEEPIVHVGEDVRVESGQEVGDVTVLFANAVVEEDATVKGDLVVVLGDATVDGIVEGGVTASNDLTIGPEGRIDGDALVLGELFGDSDAVGGQLVVPDSGLALRPDTDEIGPVMPALSREQQAAYALTTAAFATLVTVLLVALTRLVAPKATERVRHGLSSSPFESFAIGCAAWLLLPLVLLAVAITIIGIPIVLIGWAGLLLLGWTALSAVLGGRLLKGSRSLAAVVLGALVLAVLVNLVSVMGWQGFCFGGLLGFVLSSAPVGAALRTIFGTRWWPSEPPAGDIVPTGASEPTEQVTTVSPDDSAASDAQSEPSAATDTPEPHASAADPEPEPATLASEPSEPASPSEAAALASEPSEPASPSEAAALASEPSEPASTGEPASQSSEPERQPPAQPAVASSGAPQGELTRVPGITPVYALLLRQAGVSDLAALAQAQPGRVAEIASPPGVTPIDLATAERWIDTARLLTSSDD